MVAQLRADEMLYQETAVYDIADKFGEEFIYYNANGNAAISKDVLADFRRLTGDSVVWVRSERY